MGFLKKISGKFTANLFHTRKGFCNIHDAPDSCTCCLTILPNSFLAGSVPFFLIKIMRRETPRFKTNATSWVVKRCTTDFYVLIHHVIIWTITQYHLENKSSQLHPHKRIRYRTETWTGFSRGWLWKLTRDHDLMIKLKPPSICYTAHDIHLLNAPYSILRNETHLSGHNYTVRLSWSNWLLPHEE